MKQDFFQFRISDEEKAELNQLVEEMPNPDLTASQFVREAVRDRMRRERRKLQRSARTAEAANA